MQGTLGLMFHVPLSPKLAKLSRIGNTAGCYNHEMGHDGGGFDVFHMGEVACKMDNQSASIIENKRRSFSIDYLPTYLPTQVCI
jgi:hypothetical protein